MVDQTNKTEAKKVLAQPVVIFSDSSVDNEKQHARALSTEDGIDLENKINALMLDDDHDNIELYKSSSHVTKSTNQLTVSNLDDASSSRYYNQS